MGPSGTLGSRRSLHSGLSITSSDPLWLCGRLGGSQQHASSDLKLKKSSLRVKCGFDKKKRTGRVTAHPITAASFAWCNAIFYKFAKHARFYFCATISPVEMTGKAAQVKCVTQFWPLWGNPPEQARPDSPLHTSRILRAGAACRAAFGAKHSAKPHWQSQLRISEALQEKSDTAPLRSNATVKGLYLSSPQFGYVIL